MSGHFDCHRCWSEWAESKTLIERMGTRRMILCPECGNKRCPKATDHRLSCTRSNETGQSGSRYEQPARDGREE